MKKLSNFFQKSALIITQQTIISFQALAKDIELNSADNLSPRNNQTVQNINSQTEDIIPLTVNKISLAKPLQNIDHSEQKDNQFQIKPYFQNQIRKDKSIKNSSNGSITNSRIKNMENQKKRILEELKKLDLQIEDIKKQKQGHESLQKSQFYKKVSIADDLQAKKQAQSLIKQLHLEKMKIQERKRKIQQKQFEQRKRQQQQEKYQREEFQRKIKQEKRNLIEKRLQEDRKKRQQRKLADKQANLLIFELKKQEEFQKQSQLIPGQIQQYEQKKKLLQKKNIFNIAQIEDHQRKYRELKSKEKQMRKERSQSIKISYPIPKYAKNIWVQRIEEEEQRRKEEQKIKEINKKMQLQKRIKYGDIVKNIFKSKQKRIEQFHQKNSQENFQLDQNFTQNKPKTPDLSNHLPQIQQSDTKKQNKTEKRFKEHTNSTSIIQSKKSRIISGPTQSKAKDPEEVEKLIKKKQRQMQLRKQTIERLKKLENQSIQIPKSQKVKYQNYISKVKVKKAQPHEEWKKIMSNQKLSKQQKYKQMLNKATLMQNQAKIKEDLRKNGDQDAVNLYIGSIQAKLALLEKF